MIAERYRSLTRLQMCGVDLHLCPSAVLAVAIMLVNARTPIAVTSTLVSAGGTMMIIALKVRLQIALAQHFAIPVRGAKIWAYLSQIDLGRGPKERLRDVHLVGLCVIFGAWALVSLWAQIAGDPSLAATLDRLAIFLLVSGILTAIPGLGLDGTLALFPGRGRPARMARSYLGNVFSLILVCTMLALTAAMIMSILSGAFDKLGTLAVFTAMAWHLRTAAKNGRLAHSRP